MEVILIILAIIGGISSLFKDKITDQPKRRPQRQGHPRPTAEVPDSLHKKQDDRSRYEPSRDAIKRQERRDEQMHRAQEKVGEHQANPDAQVKEGEHKAKLDEQAIFGEHKANIDTQISAGEHKADVNEGNHNQKKHKNFAKTAMQKRVQNNLNRKGVVDGVIMSEVLGSPRARKPFRSVVAKRSK